MEFIKKDDQEFLSTCGNYCVKIKEFLDKEIVWEASRQWTDNDHLVIKKTGWKTLGLGSLRFCRRLCIVEQKYIAESNIQNEKKKNRIKI